MSTSQAQILEYVLKSCVFDGFGTDLLENAALSAGLDKNYWQIDFPNGAIDVIDYFLLETDRKMAAGLDRSNLRTHERVRAAVKLRMEINAEHKEQIRAMLGILALHPLRATKFTYRTVDNIWRLCGDTATDWNFYSKRALLAGVYSSTLVYWLNSDDDNKTWEFLDRRLAEVGKVGKGIGKAKEKLNSLKVQFN